MHFDLIGSEAGTSRSEIIDRAAKPLKLLLFSTPARLYVYDTLLERLAQDLQDMAAALGPFIQEEHAVVGQRHLAGHRYVAAADQPRIRDGLVGRAKRAGRDQRRAVAGEAGDTMDARGLNGFGEGHRRQDGGESAGQPSTCPPQEGRGGGTSGVVVAAQVMGSYGPLWEPLTIVGHAAKVTKKLTSSTPAKLYVYETILGWLQ